MADPVKYFLLPGGLKFTSHPMEITTLLGSCIAVCLYDPKLKNGGINHFMMPYWNGTGLASPKYGNIAIEKLIRGMQNIGSKKENIIAKIFGGASVLNNDDNIFNIGKRNIDVVTQMLEEHSIKVVGKSLGGDSGRKIIFNTSTGLVRMKFVSKTNQ